jgi:hypothetical protein
MIAWQYYSACELRVRGRRVPPPTAGAAGAQPAEDTPPSSQNGLYQAIPIVVEPVEDL